MAIFQCTRCGVAENSALGIYNRRHRNSRFFSNVEDGEALCCMCAPSMYKNGSPTKYTGQWHGCFERHYLPKGSCFTNRNGNLEHTETGLIGTALYKALGKSTPYSSETD